MSGIINSAGSRSGVIDKKNIHIGSFTFDMTANGTSTQDITDVGFRPKEVIFMACHTEEKGHSWGFDNTSGTNQVIMYRPAGVGLDYKMNQDTGRRVSIRIGFAANTDWASLGEISATSSDGFTITWENPTYNEFGLAGVIYMAFR